MQKQHWLFNGCFEWPHDEPEKASFMSETKRCPACRGSVTLSPSKQTHPTLPVLKWRCFKAHEKTLLIEPKGKLGSVRSRNRTLTSPVFLAGSLVSNQKQFSTISGVTEMVLLVLLQVIWCGLVLEATPKEGW
jgi:hypothetical protein